MGQYAVAQDDSFESRRFLRAKFRPYRSSALGTARRRSTASAAVAQTPMRMRPLLLVDCRLFVFAAMTNDTVLMNKQLRKIFEEECLNGSHAHRYRERCEQLHRRWQWFDPRPTADWMMEVKSEASMDPTERRFSELLVSLKPLEKAVALLPWFIIGLGVLMLWRV